MEKQKQKTGLCKMISAWMICIVLVMSVPIQAQNLLAGWDDTTGTPYDAGWRVDESISVTWGNLAASSGNRYRINVGSPASNGADQMLYITEADTKYGYPVRPVENKFYQLSGKVWRRNGGSGSATFNFYFADDLLATKPVSKNSLTLSGNNVVNTFNSLRFVAPEGFTSGYFLWDVHVNSGNWNEAGIWLLQLTELGNAVSVKFDTNGGSSVDSQYFLDGESYTISKPADPVKDDGSPFDGWYADKEFTIPYDFSVSITTATTVYAKWEDASVVKAQLQTLISEVEDAKEGGTEAGINYLQTVIGEAQAIVDNSGSTISDFTAAISNLNAALAVYHDHSLKELLVGGTIIPGFSATTYIYTYDLAPEASIPTVTAAAIAPVASAGIEQASAIPGSTVVTVMAGDGSTQTYTVTFRVNYMAAWDGNGMGTTTDIPNNFGWQCSSDVIWVSADNSNDTYAYRYRDNFGSGVGRVITHPVNNSVFSFPVSLTGGKVYNFTCRNSNVNGTCTTMFGINTSKDAMGTMLNSQSKTSAKWSSLTTFNFNFAAAVSGTYYMVWQTTNGTDRNIATDFLLTEVGNALNVSFNTDGGSEVATQYFVEGESYAVNPPVEPTKNGYVFSGWYKDNTYTSLFNFNIPVLENTIIYARFVPDENPTMTSLTINNETIAIQSAKYMNITANGTSELHISGESPLVGSTINLASDNAWLYLESVKPSEVTSNYLSSIKINGQDFNAETDRMAIYGSGTVIIPQGKQVSKHALIAYTGNNYGGESMEFEVEKYYRTAELGAAFDNKIRSFKLKKGYSCTLANNPDGTGFSRVYIASDADIEVPEMPEGLEFVSFVRVFRWEWVGKKGICNGGLAAITNSSWYNDWAAGGATDNPDFEYVPMRHNLGWDSFETINTRTNVSHVLGYNEPDHTDQANCTPIQAIRQWPELFKSGLRLGSPTPDAIRKDWLVKFLELADSLNYRVDFVVGHMYWNGQSGQNLYNGVVDACTRLYGGRPMWITEWNNGANWTTENWPTNSGPQRDADLNIIYDEDGNEKTVTRPLSPENAAKQATWILDALDGLERCEYLERHSLYNWVQDARAMVLDNKLTPAGKNFAAYKSKVGFSKAREYTHTWKIAPPLPNYTLSKDYKSITISWYDHNGETGKNYTLQKSVDGGEWTDVKVFIAAAEMNPDNPLVYTYGSTISYTEEIDCISKVDYRIIALSYKDTQSSYSRTVSVTRDAVPDKPVLQGEALSSKIIKLTWSAVDNARSYRLERAESANGEYTEIANLLTGTTYMDENLAVNTPYYYKLYALSTAATEPVSDVLTVSTKELIAPSAIDGLRIAAGDGRLTLTWDFAYDAKYRVLRAEEKDASYKQIADAIETTRYADNGLVEGTTYYYKVQAYNTAGDGPESEVLSAMPVGGQHIYMSFDENAGTTAFDAWGGYHGTLLEGAEWTTGKTGSAVALTKSKSSYIQLQDGALSSLEDFTIATWVNFNGGMGRLFDFGTGTGTFMMLAPATTKIRYKITCGAGTFDITIPCAIKTKEWVHFAMTQAGTSVKFYLNGTCVGTGENTDKISPKDMGITTQNYLGKSQWSSDAYCDHIYDDFRIYNKALSDLEVAKLADAIVTVSVYKGNNTEETVEVYRDGSGLADILTGNTIAVVDDADGINLPEGQNNVVVKNAANTYSCTSLLLTDKQPFYSPVSFTAASAVYRRDLTGYVYADGANGWSSLVLPFAGTLYAGEDAKKPFISDDDAFGNYWLKTFAGKTNGTMNFEYASSIEADIPYIIALPGERWGVENSIKDKEIEVRGTDVTVSATKGIAKVTADDYSFNGTYAVVQPVGTHYILNAEGNAFIKHDDGATVEPFRCYLLPDVESMSMPKSFSIGGGNGEITGLENGTKDHAGKLRVYSEASNLKIVSPKVAIVQIHGADGVLVRTVQLQEGVNTVTGLAPGFYVVEGQKVVIYSK